MYWTNKVYGKTFRVNNFIWNVLWVGLLNRVSKFYNYLGTEKKNVLNVKKTKLIQPV